jgi:putative flippase GtrA
VTAVALVVDAGVFVTLFDLSGWNLTRSAAIAGEAGILFTVLLHDLWTFAGRPGGTSLDRIRRLIGIHIALGVLLFARLAVTNALVNWFNVGPLTAFLIALVVVMPGGHLLGSRLSWRSRRD